MQNLEQTIHDLESRLISAMIESDVAVLDALIDDSLIFIGLDGKCYSKEEDLELHRTRQTKIERIDVEERIVKLYDSTAIVTVAVAMKGSFQGNAFSGRFRYLRAWHNHDGEFRVVAGSVFSLSNAN